MSTKIIQTFAGALWGLQIGSTTMTAVNAVVTATSLNDTLNKYFTEKFGKLTPTEIGELLVTNLGISAAGKAEAVAYVVGKLGAATPATYGQVISGILTDFAGLTANATFGAAATAWNAKVATAEAYTGAGDLAVGTIVGGAFTLTTSVDVFEGTLGDDTYTAASTTLAAADVVSDKSATDKDVMNITLTAAAPAATIKNIETINVNQNYFAGAATDIDATNITGATINLSSSKLGFNGTSGVVGLGANTVKAGTGITSLTVTGVTTGTVDAGSAAVVAVTGTTVANKIVINGNAALTNTTSTKTTLDVTANSTITYDTTAVTNATTLTGAGNVYLKMNGADVIAGTSLVKNNSGTIQLQVTAGAAFDATNFVTDSIIVGDVATVAATVASGAKLQTSAAITSLTVATTPTTATTANLVADHDITTLDVSDARLSTNVTADTANIAIGTLTTVATNTVNFTGSKNVTVSASGTGTVNAAALTGSLAYTATLGTTQTITGSATAANTLTTGTTSIVSYTGGSGVDTALATALTTGTLGFDGGAGDDVVRLDQVGAATIALEGGSGTDTLQLPTGGTTAVATIFAINGFENIQVRKTADNVVDALTLAMGAKQINGKTLTVNSQEAIDTLTLAITGATSSNKIDLSNITLESGDATTIAASATTGATVQTIIGTNVKDTITASTGKHSYTGGAGGDFYTFAAADSTATLMTTITDFAPAASSSDKLTLASAAGTLVTTALAATNVTGLDKTNDTAITAALAAKSGTVNVAVANGIMSLSGLAADVALINTLDEWLLIAADVLENDTGADAALAFVFNGNTYVVDGATAADGTFDNVIMLTGTPATKLGLTAAADTIFVA